jgi:two-component sensor histidine kinase
MPSKLLLLFLILFSPLQAVTVSEHSASQHLLPYSDIFIDDTSDMDLKTVKQHPFHPFGADYIRLGYTSDTLWVRFVLENPSDKQVKKDLVLDNCMLDTVTLFRPDGSEETTGVLHKTAYDGSRLHPYFTVVLPAHFQGVFYLRSQTDSCANHLRLTLLSPEKAWFKELRYQLAMALFFGAMLALGVYNLFVWFFTRERVYLYYVLYLFSWVVTHISFSCMGQHLFERFPWFIRIDAFLGIYYNSINAVLGILFLKAFFQTPRNYPRINRFFNASILYFLLLSLFSSIWTYQIEVLAFSLVAVFSAIALLLFYWLLKGVEQARFIFAGWIIAVTGIVSMAIDQIGIANPIDHWRYFFEFSLVAEALLFSVALAARLNKTRALEQALSTQKVLLHELHHRVKNNMQTIISMYRLKLAGATAESLKSKMDEVERTVQSMSRIHEMLYAQKEIGDVDAESYLALLIEQLRQSAPPHVSITLDTDVHLATDRAIYCAVIINELVTNALKYAFDAKGGNVKVALHQDGDDYILQVSDDGKGMDAETAEGFGLSLVRAFAQDELGGTLKMNARDGSRFTITFKM